MAYREALQPADVHHHVGVLGDDVGVGDGVAQRRDHLGPRARLLRVRQYLLHEQVILLNPLDWLNQ